MIETKQPLASENCHYYDQQGGPVYEVPRKDGQGMRPTTLADARKLDLVPSVTTILQCASKPGLEAWKARQILEAALTLPRHPTETLDDYAQRVIEDSKQQGKKAAERGTDLHAAIESYLKGSDVGQPWGAHCEKLWNTLNQLGIDLLQGKPEHSFASWMGFGGKLDTFFTDPDIVIDYKTKDSVADKKQLAWPENCWQLAAYGRGLDLHKPRLINVFVGIKDCEIRIHEWNERDAQQGWNAFECLLKFWQITKNWKQNP